MHALAARTVASSPLRHLSTLPPQYLASMNPSIWNPSTHQRDHIVIHPTTGVKQIPQQNPKACPADAFPSNYLASLGPVHQIPVTPPPTLGTFQPPPINHWRGETLKIPTLEYAALMDPSTAVTATASVLGHLYATGICLVKNTPVSDEGMRALTYVVTGGHPTKAEGVNNGPLKTLYGEVWHTSSGAQGGETSTADSAYTSKSLPLHTDMTYHATPPGLQVFNMACPASDGSGASTYLDGFAAAERLFEVDKEAWKILTETAFKYRSMDEGMGWHLEAVGRIIEVDEFDERTVKGIRHNDLDRMGAMPKASVIAQGEDAVREWYITVERALEKWDSVLNESGRRVTVSLQEGDCTLVCNRRVMHGRESFVLEEGDKARSIVGSYTGVDDLESRWRVCFTFKD